MTINRQNGLLLPLKELHGAATRWRAINSRCANEVCRKFLNRLEIWQTLIEHLLGEKGAPNIVAVYYYDDVEVRLLDLQHLRVSTRPAACVCQRFDPPILLHKKPEPVAGRCSVGQDLRCRHC